MKFSIDTEKIITEFTVDNSMIIENIIEKGYHNISQVHSRFAKCYFQSVHYPEVYYSWIDVHVASIISSDSREIHGFNEFISYSPNVLGISFLSPELKNGEFYYKEYECRQIYKQFEDSFKHIAYNNSKITNSIDSQIIYSNYRIFRYSQDKREINLTFLNDSSNKSIQDKCKFQISQFSRIYDTKHQILSETYLWLNSNFDNVWKSYANIRKMHNELSGTRNSDVFYDCIVQKYGTTDFYISSATIYDQAYRPYGVSLRKIDKDLELILSKEYINSLYWESIDDFKIELETVI